MNGHDEMEPHVLRYLAKAVEAIQDAASNTGDGFCSDHCLNALKEIKRAIFYACGIENYVAPKPADGKPPEWMRRGYAVLERQKEEADRRAKAGTPMPVAPEPAATNTNRRNKGVADLVVSVLKANHPRGMTTGAIYLVLPRFSPKSVHGALGPLVKKGLVIRNSEGIYRLV